MAEIKDNALYEKGSEIFWKRVDRFDPDCHDKLSECAENVYWLGADDPAEAYYVVTEHYGIEAGNELLQEMKEAGII